MKKLLLAALLFFPLVVSCVKPVHSLSPLFYQDLGVTTVEKADRSYVLAIRELVRLFEGTMHRQISFDSLWNSTRGLWVSQVYSYDSLQDSGVVRQQSWPSTGKVPSVTLGKASWVLAMHSLGLGIVGMDRMSLPAAQLAMKYGGVVFIELPTRYYWIDGISGGADRFDIWLSDSSHHECDANGNTKNFCADSVRQCIIVLPNDSLVCPFIKAVAVNIRSGKPHLYWYPGFLKEYARQVLGNKRQELFSWIPDRYPCGRFTW